MAHHPPTPPQAETQTNWSQKKKDFFTNTMLLLTLLFTTAALPSDWSAAFEAGRIVASDSPLADRDCPVVGNGFVGYRLCGFIGPNPYHDDEGATLGAQDSMEGGMHVAAVRTGFHNASIPSHRATIPSPFNVRAEGEMIGAKLDLESGAATNRTKHCDIVLDVTQLPHRTHRNVLLLRLNASGSGSCNVSLTPLGSVPSYVLRDMNVVSDAISEGVRSWEGTTRIAEVASMPLSGVALMHDVVPSTVMISNTTDRLFYAVVRSTVEGISNTTLLANTTTMFRDVKQSTWKVLSAENTASMSALHHSGIEVTGNATVARALNSSLFYLLQSLRSDGPFGMSTSGLGTDGYWGRTYWDMEMFQLPPLLLTHRELVYQMAHYRLQQIPAAKQRALWAEHQGAMFPWQAGMSGYDCSQPGSTLFGQHEQHISGDIAMAMKRIYHTTGNTSFLRDTAWQVSYPICQFWSGRFERHASGNFTILNVVPPDEHAGLRNSSVYTNAVAAQSLSWCLDIVNILGNTITPPTKSEMQLWELQAASPYLPIKNISGVEVHPEYEGYDGTQVNQDDVGLLVYPLSLEEGEIAKNDVTFYMERTPADGMFTGDSMYSIAMLQLGNATLAENMWEAGMLHQAGGFNAWRERLSGGALNFLTGAGGFLMNLMYGWAGLRITADLLSAHPQLPPSLSQVRLRALSYKTAEVTLTYTATQTTLEITTMGGFEVKCGGGVGCKVSPCVCPAGEVTVVVE